MNCQLANSFNKRIANDKSFFVQRILEMAPVRLLLIVFFIPVIVGFSLSQTVTPPSWQELLKQKFDIVETFDSLQDWRGGMGYHYDAATMPRELDGRPSMWTYYTSSDTQAAVDDWISFHGAQYTWRGRGKSLCINYDNFVGAPAGYGPARLGTFFGDGISGKSGYRKIFIFLMLKFRPGFFAKTGSNFNYVGTLKFMDIGAGFTTISQFGNSSEYASTCETPIQIRREYGANFTMLNLNGGGLSNPTNLFFMENVFTAYNPNGCWKYQGLIQSRRLDSGGSSSSLAQFYSDSEASNQWIGVEFALDTGTLGNADGSQEVWLYDANGKQKGYFSVSGYNKLMQFDHRYNKVVIGGNRFGAGYSLDEGDSNENRYYVDDFIINGGRIAPTYFSILNSRPPAPTVKTP